mmetsp:Transcript_57752/g.179376  ORF Transcript_57752/g.179376 Transcript_57752/m.179376 type:complete len:100 (-) Transcript_57752:230-529(-)
MNTGIIDASDLPFYEDAEEVMEAIASLTPKRENGQLSPRSEEEAHGGMLRQGSASSLASFASSATSGSDADTTSGTRKRSVLMVTPAATTEESKKHAWW